MMLRKFVAPFGLAGLLFAGSARADDAAAQSLFDDAKKLIADGKWAAACPKLEESLRISPTAGTKFNLGDCYEHTGKTASAWAQFLSAATQTKIAGQKDREKAARDRAAALEPKLSRLAIVVAADARPAGLEVKRDAELVGQAQWGEAVPVDPGEHAVVASAPGKRPWKAKVEVSGAGTTAKLSVPELDDAAPVAAPAGPATDAPAPKTNEPLRDTTPRATGNPNATLGWVLVGVGGAAVVGGVVMFVLRGNEVSKLESACGADGKSCPPSSSDDIANGKTYTALGIGLFGLGVVSAGAGVGLLVTGGKDKTAAQVRLVPIGRGAGLVGTF
jgi:hypothetical protein